MRNNPLCAMTFIMSVVFATGLSIAGLDNIEDFELLASDGGASDEFGTAVAVSGDIALVGVPNDDDNGSNAGAAYIFRFNGTTWTQEAKLLANDGEASDEFGTSVALDGTIALIGAPNDDENGSDAGAVYVFSFDGSQWYQETKLLASEGGSSDEFGISVSVSGDFAIVGAYLEDDLGNNSGAAYAYRTNGTSWTEISKLLPKDGGNDDRFGWSVCIDGDVAVIGSRWDDDNGLNSGAAYVFRFNGFTWVEEQKLYADDGDVSDQFGWSCAIDQDTILIGSRYDDDNGSASGSAYMYYFNGKQWDQYLKLLPSNGSSTDYFGDSVAIKGDMAIVGARGVDDPSNSGTAYVFITFNDGVTWLEGYRCVASDDGSNDALGFSVAFDGDTVIAGSPFHDDNGSNSGAAYLYWPFMVDCNDNDVPDNIDIASGYSGDCNGNGIPDECDTSDGTSDDCNNNGIPDECEDDCNGNSVADECDISDGTSDDCNGNGVPDECDIADGTSQDCNDNGRPDSCDTHDGTSEDCNKNNIPDECDIVDGTSFDIDFDDIPDECELDCNENSIPDHYEIKNGMAEDCNDNGVPDWCDIDDGTSTDYDFNGVPDECEDCNGNGLPDDWEIKVGAAEDCNNNGVIDSCDIADGTSQDCNSDVIPDECELVDNDCNENGVPDDCDIADGTSTDSDGDGIPDECEKVPTCDGDADGDGVVGITDLLIVIGEFGSLGPLGDLNGDGIVDISDLLLVVGNWGSCP